METLNVTCNGVLSDASLVNPTKSLKNNEAESNVSAVTGCPLFNSSATVLWSYRKKKESVNAERIKHTYLFIYLFITI